jgi:tryptophan halogenase
MGDFPSPLAAGPGGGFGADIGDYCFELKAAEAGKFATSDKMSINYAYHLDAGRYARFLRGFCRDPRRAQARGQDQPGSSSDGETGFISALALESGELVEGDLFIDCTGFRGLLIEQTLEAGYEDWTQWLPTNSALPLQTASVGRPSPIRGRSPIRRDGSGGSRCSIASATAWSIAVTSCQTTTPRSCSIPASRARSSSSRARSAFAPDVAARSGTRTASPFGLSSGFVEPLESTSIHLFMIGATRLVQLFPFGGISEAVANRYNELSRHELEAIRDFIVLHYKLTARDDSGFWNHCREMAIPDSLSERIELFREHALAYQASDELFRVDSWVQVMLGQGLKPRSWHKLGQLMTDAQLRKALTDLKGNIAKAVAGMPAHQAFLDQYCGTGDGRR